MVTVPGLTEDDTVDPTDLIVVETASGTRKRVVFDNLPRQGQLTGLSGTSIDLNETIFGWDDATGDPVEIPIGDILFGNYANASITASTTLQVPLHNVRPIQIGGATTQITLDANEADIGGAVFSLFNFRGIDINVVRANGIELFVDGVDADAVIRAKRGASIMVANDATSAIFEGG